MAVRRELSPARRPGAPAVKFSFRTHNLRKK
jgi:hypothetical protein